MQIHLNGQPYVVSQSSSLATLLESLDLHNKRVAIELNQHIIPRGLHTTTHLNEGDVVEVIQAIAGG